MFISLLLASRKKMQLLCCLLFGFLLAFAFLEDKADARAVGDALRDARAMPKIKRTMSKNKKEILETVMKGYEER